MKTPLFAVAAAALLICASPAFASSRGTMETILKNAPPLGPEDRKALTSFMRVDCTVNEALMSALNDNASGFEENLKTAAADLAGLKTLSDNLRKHSYNKFVNRASAPIVYLDGRAVPVRDGDEILAAIEVFVDDANAAIKVIQDGKGDAAELTRLTADTAKISELILQFLTLHQA